jgi:predicted phosphodiesterase
MKMLERYEGAPVDSLRHATRQALIRLVDQAIDSKVDFVLLAGDIYDGDWRDYNTGLFFVQQMSKLASAHIPVLIIAGNHDAANKMTRQLRLPRGVQILSADSPTTVVWDQLGVAVHGQSFPRAAVTDDLSRSYPAPIPGLFNIGLLHTCAEGREGHDSYAPCSVDDLRRKGYDYWALGHIHQREILHQNPMIVFPGNTQGRSIRETGPKGCLRVQIPSSSAPTLEFLPLHSAQWEHLHIALNASSNVDSILEQVTQSLQQLIDKSADINLVARITLAGEWSRDRSWPDPDQWAGEIRSLATNLSGGSIWIEKVKTSLRWIDQGMDDAPTQLALHALLRQWQSLRSSDAPLQSIADSLKTLQNKLPPELALASGIDFTSPTQLRQLLDDVVPLLTELFRKAEESPA